MVASDKKIFSLSRLFSFVVNSNSSGEKVASLQRSLIESIGHAEEFSHSLLRARLQEQKKQAVKEAAAHANQLQKSLQEALRFTKYLRNSGKGNTDKYYFFDHLYGSCGLVLTMTEHLKVPYPTASHWEEHLAEIQEKVGDNGIIGCCGEMIDLLEEYGKGNISSSLQRKA